jgi:hypothetical protein
MVKNKLSNGSIIDAKEIKYYEQIKKLLPKTQELKYHNFNINIYFIDREDFKNIIYDLKIILKYFTQYEKDNIVINILDYKQEKLISNNWQDFISGFFIFNYYPKTIYLTRIIEWQRTLIHELVHCCFNIKNEINTEMKTIEIYKELFGISKHQICHSIKLLYKLSNMQSNNLFKYTLAYLQELNKNKCNCDIKYNFRYICTEY